MPDGNFRRRVFVGHGGAAALDDFPRGPMAPSYHSYGLARLGGFAQLGQSGSLQPIDIPLAGSGLCQKMFCDLQR